MSFNPIKKQEGIPLTNELTEDVKKTKNPEMAKTDELIKQSVNSIHEEPSDSINYLDKYNLLKATHPAEIQERHFDWYLNEAILLSAAKACKNKGDIRTEKGLELAILQGYSKAATIGEENAKTLGIKTSPFLPED